MESDADAPDITVIKKTKDKKLSRKTDSSTPTILNWFTSDKRYAIDRIDTNARKSKKPRTAATKPDDIENLPDCSHPSTSEIVPSSSTINSIPKEDVSSTSTNTEDIEEDFCPIPAAKEDTEEDFGLNYAPDNNLIEQYMPPKNFKFPQETDGYSAGRSCQHGWFEKFSWLHYNTAKDALLCYTCISGNFKKLSISSNDEDKAFVDSGIRNWKRALEKLKKHEKSLHHKNIEAQLLSLEKGTPVSNLLNTKLKSDQIKARKALRYIMTGIRYLARTGQPLRGHANNNDGNLYIYLQELETICPEIESWLSKRNKWTSPDIQNEILEMLAHSMQRALLEKMKDANFFGIIADGTTDAAGKEQFSICVRYLAKHLGKTEDMFLGLFNAPDTTGETLTKVIKDVLQRCNIDLNKFRGHCFDGAGNMSGIMQGVQTRFKELQPKSFFVHCANHSLDLALQEVARSNRLIADSLSLIKTISNLIRESSKRRDVYKNIVLCPTNNEEESNINLKPNQLLPLCPTRWAVRFAAISRFVENYPRVLETLDALLKDPTALRREKKVEVKGFIRSLKKFKTFVGMNMAKELFGPCEILAKVLQTTGFSAASVKNAVSTLEETIQRMREDSHFETLYKKWERKASTLNLEMKMTSDSRQKIVPIRYEQTSHPSAPAQLGQEEKLRVNFREALDLITNALKKRFDQKTFESLIKIESIFTDTASNTSEDLKQKLGIHADDFDLTNLSAQLTLLPTLIPDETDRNALSIAIKIMSSEELVKKLFSEVYLLAEFILAIPTSVATAERSFSALRRLQTHLRTTMGQQRLNHLMLLHIYKEEAFKIDLEAICKEFISKTTERTLTFGKWE